MPITFGWWASLCLYWSYKEPMRGVNVIKKIATGVLVAFALVFMAATIFNPNSRYYISEDVWLNLWRAITGQ